MQERAKRDVQDWNSIADCYSQMAGMSDDQVYRDLKAALWASLGDLQSRSVLDLGCGNGWLSSHLADTGARVVGVDGAATLLDHARHACPDITFIEHDLMQGLPPLGQSFDVVLSHMVLMDLPDIAPVVRDVRRILTDQGRFIFTLPHPSFFNMKVGSDPATGQRYRMVTGYLAPQVWRIDTYGGHNHYHRSLGYYVDQLRAVGLAITWLHEPPRVAGPVVSAGFSSDIPVFMLIEATPLTR